MKANLAMKTILVVLQWRAATENEDLINLVTPFTHGRDALVAMLPSRDVADGTMAEVPLCLLEYGIQYTRDWTRRFSHARVVQMIQMIVRMS